MLGSLVGKSALTLELETQMNTIDPDFYVNSLGMTSPATTRLRPCALAL